MAPSWTTRLAVTALAVTLSGLPALAASGPLQQTPPAQAPPRASADQSLDRIREAVAKPPAIVIDNGQLRIYMEVIAKWPSFAEMAKGYDLINGPTKRGNPMTHQEFLSMVTPKEMYGSAGIKPVEMLEFAITNWLGQAIIMKGLEALRNAKTEREIAEIRARIDRELAALRAGK